LAQQTTDLQTEHINYPGATGEVRAYFARPNGDEKRPGVVVIHENQGLAPHIEDVNRRIASEGFLSLAPDSLTPLGGTPQDLDKAIELTKELDGQATLENYLAAVQYLKTHPGSTGRVGVIGFCWGGRMANLVAVNAPDVSAVVPFYGQQPASEDVPKIKASLLLHYAGLDEKINAGIPAYEAALKEAGIAYQIYMYEGAKHAFHNDAKADRYHKEAAQLAWKRTVEFLNKKLK
jgi:carboxymethylenebutenolidase